MALSIKGKVVSIVINNEFIKIFEASKNGKNITIHKEVTLPLIDSSYADGSIRSMGGLSKTIRTALDDNRISTSNVVFSVNSTKIATKEVVIPNIKENKIDGVIRANASEYFPVKIEDYIVQYTILEKFEEDGTAKLKILVMAAPNKMINEYYILASKLNMNVMAIDYMGNSISQALRQQIGSEACAVIQVENDATIVNIFHNNILQLQRTIPYGKSILVNEVMEKFSLSYDTAFEKLQHEELIHQSFDGDELTELLRPLTSNINRVMDYYISRNARKTIEKAYVVGGAASINGFVRFIANELHVELTNIVSFKDVLLDKKTYVDSSKLPSYICNIGSLINPVNFVPRLMVEEEKAKDTSKFFKILMVGAVLISVILVVTPMISLITAKNDKDSLQKQVDDMKDIEVVVNDYYNAKDKLTDVQDFKSLTLNDDDTMHNFITILEEKMPSDTSITSMNVASGTVTISGTATSKSSVAKFIQQLQSVKSIENVIVSSETETKDNTDAIVVTFSLTCTFSDVTVE